MSPTHRSIDALQADRDLATIHRLLHHLQAEWTRRAAASQSIPDQASLDLMLDEVRRGVQALESVEALIHRWALEEAPASP